LSLEPPNRQHRFGRKIRRSSLSLPESQGRCLQAAQSGQGQEGEFSRSVATIQLHARPRIPAILIIQYLIYITKTHNQWGSDPFLYTRLPYSIAPANTAPKHSVTSRRSPYLTLRSLTLYIYGAPLLDVSRSHTTTQHSR